MAKWSTQILPSTYFILRSSNCKPLFDSPFYILSLILPAFMYYLKKKGDHKFHGIRQEICDHGIFPKFWDWRNILMLCWRSLGIKYEVGNILRTPTLGGFAT